MLRFEGDKDFPQPAAVLWDRLGDARFLVSCIPGVETVTRSEPTEAAFVIRPGLAFVRGTLATTLRVAEAIAPTSLKLHVASKGIGTTSAVEAALAFAPHDGGTRLHWAADVTELGGLLKAVPQGLIKAAAQKVIADVWTEIEAKLRS